MGKKLWPHQMRINSLDDLVFDPLTRWEIWVRWWRQLLGMPVRSGIVSREREDE